MVVQHGERERGRERERERGKMKDEERERENIFFKISANLYSNSEFLFPFLCVLINLFNEFNFYIETLKLFNHFDHFWDLISL